MGGQLSHQRARPQRKSATSDACVVTPFDSSASHRQNVYVSCGQTALQTVHWKISVDVQWSFKATVAIDCMQPASQPAKPVQNHNSAVYGNISRELKYRR